MPYITREARTKLAEHPHPMTTGELNYLICLGAMKDKADVASILRIVKRYRMNELQSYSRLNDIMGALDGAARELARRGFSIATGIVNMAQFDFYHETVAPYEDEKLRFNGDVF